ncbi:MAG: hypothetical protein U9P72_07310, partial [Campylobacterota bacterium]|nr:hypothetical protein [Campylobacterota bacterium]
MFNILNNIKITSSVSAIQIINNNIYVLGSNYLLNIFKRDDFSTIDNMPLFENANHRHIYDKSYAISNNIDIYISQSENYNGHIFSKEGIKLTKEDSLDFHDNSVSVSKFSNDSTLIAIGDEDGKVFFYRSDIDQLLFSLPPMADAISSISFSDDDKFTAIASYDKSINIYSMTANKKISTTAISDVVEDMLFLDNGQKLIGVTRDKKIFSYDVLTDEISYGDFEFSEWPTTIKRVGKDSLIVGSRGQNLYLIKTNSLEILKEIELPNTGVKTLFIHKNYLYVGYVDGNIDTIDTQYKLQEFEINLNINKFEEASSLLEKNIFLLIETIADKYDMEWENILNQAKILLSEHKNDEALALVEPFFFDKKKEKAYNFLNANKNNFIHFNKLIQEDKVMIALMFADIHEYLKDTAEY